MESLSPAVIESFTTFCDHFRIPLFPWQREAFGLALAREGGRFLNRVAGISVPRGNGKSYGGSAAGLWRLVVGRPGSDLISAALDYDGAKIVLEHARDTIRDRPALAELIEVQAGGLLLPATGSRWTVVSREHTGSRGRHPDLVIYDECGWARDDELFSSLLAGQASVPDPLMLVISTVGRRQAGPLWTVKLLAEGGDPAVSWWHSSANLSPLITEAFLERQRRILLPAQYAREHQNTWVDAADGYTSSAEVDGAMGRGWVEQHVGAPGVHYDYFVDLGAVHDPSVIGIGHRDGDMVYVDTLITFQGSHSEPVNLAAVEARLVELAKLFPPRKIRIESWQGLGAAQSLKALGLPVALFVPTAKAHSEEWPQLSQALSSGRLVLYPHARLREELLNLVYEVGPAGVKVIDRGKVHQDHAVVVRGIVAGLRRQRPLWTWV